MDYKQAEIIDLYEDLNIIELVAKLDETIGWTNISDWFNQLAISANPPSQFKGSDFPILKISYLEHCRIWKPKWARQIRGLVVAKIVDRVVCIKSLLPRGAEVLTGMHISSGIKFTQDINTETTDVKKTVFDDVQTDTISKLINQQPITGKLSFKNDGSLLGIVMWDIIGCPQLGQLFDTYADKFAKQVRQIAYDLNMFDIPIFTSKDTMFISEGQQEYVLTSIACGFLKMKFEDVVELINKDKSTAIERLTSYVIPPLLNVFRNFNIWQFPKGMSCFSFETVCERRTTAWGDVHHEMAVSYDRSSFKFLGCTVGIDETGGIFIPHSDIETPLQFDEPMYWSVTHSSQIESMLIDLEKVVDEKMSEQDYLKLYPPSNKRDVINSNFDYEGFVFFRETNSSLIVDHHFKILKMEPRTLTVYDYSKIKTKIYYHAHKLKQSNIPILMATSDTASKIFPLIRNIKMFMTNLASKLLTVTNSLKKNLEENKELFSALPVKAQESFVKQKKDVQYRMLMNASDKFKDIAFGCFQEVFPAINTDQIDHGILKKLSMAWTVKEMSEADFDVLIKNMDPNIQAFAAEIFKTN